MLQITDRQLDRWQRSGLLPERSTFSFEDLLALRKLRQLSTLRVPLRTIRESLRALRELAVGGEQPLARVGVFAVDRRLELVYEGQRLDPQSGQLRLSLSSDSGPRICDFKSKTNPAAAEEWFAYAVALEERPENREKAAAAYMRCLELEPRYASAYINLGTLRYNHGDFKEAERCYRAALVIDPKYALAYFDLGNVLDETGRLTQAIEAYKSAVKLAPNYADAHYNLALAYEKCGQRRTAVSHWRAYLRLDTTSPWAKHARNQLKRTLEQDILKLVR
jgi:tetratricopeptide (TPR) repeat protein